MGGEGGVVGFVGLDSFSFELASSLLRSGFTVQAFEVSCFQLLFFFGSACMYSFWKNLVDWVSKIRNQTCEICGFCSNFEILSLSPSFLAVFTHLFKFSSHKEFNSTETRHIDLISRANFCDYCIVY